MEIKNFFKNSEIELTDLGNNVSRKVIAYNKEIMLVEVHFKTGSVGTNHVHPHSQATYVIEGKFEFNVNGKKQIVEKGDSIYMEPDVDHGCTCLSEGVLLDVFTPYRETFLK